MNTKKQIFICFIIQIVFSTFLFATDLSVKTYQDKYLIDTYQINNSLETENLIHKSYLEHNVIITNTLSNPQTVHYIFYPLNRNKKWYYRLLDKIPFLDKPQVEISKKLTLNPNQKINLTIPKKFFLKKLTLESTDCLNIQYNLKNKTIDIDIAKQPLISFPRVLPFFDFNLRFINDPQIAHIKHFYDPTKVSFLSKKFRKRQKSFDVSLKFLLTEVFVEEKIHSEDFFKKWKDLDSKYNLNQLFFKEKPIDKNIPYRIPQFIHRIWLTSMDTPKELPSDYIKWALEALRSNPLSEGWNHIFWIQNKSKLPRTVKILQENGIEIREIKSCNMSAVDKKNLDQTIEKNKFGQASDILRCIILKEYGGVYVDTDYLLVQSLNVFNKIYDFFVGLEPMSPFIGNAIIGAYPHHPVIKQALKLIDRNLNPKLIPDYIKNIPSKSYFTVYSTGPGALTVAFHQAAGQYKGSEQNRDILLQSIVLYPTESNFYPNGDHLGPDDRIALPSLGVHFWHGTWLKEEFKSVG